MTFAQRTPSFSRDSTDTRLLFEVNAGGPQLVEPVLSHCLTELLIVQTSICKECSCNEAITEYLSNADERLTWQSHSLPVDDLCTENAIILKCGA
jgi:hypothetical protein